jgi:hypothetical protein
VVLIVTILATVLLLTSCASRAPAPQAACELDLPIEVSQAAADAFELKVHRAFLSGQAGPFRLETTSTEVTSFLYYAAKGTPLQQPYVRFMPDQVCLGGDLLVFNPIRTSFSLLATCTVSEGQVNVHLERVFLGSRSLPRPVVGYFTRIINETIRDAQLRVTITELHLEEDRLILTGTR